MAHFVALDENKDPLPRGDDPRPEEEADEDETLSVLFVFTEVASPEEDSLCSWQAVRSEAEDAPGFEPLANTVPVRLSKDGVGEAAELTRTPPLWCCCSVAAISDCQAINLNRIMCQQKLTKLRFSGSISQ
jgi:hypothetical protein